MNGFIYYTVGDECIVEANRSIDSLLRLMNDAKITVYTDQPDKFCQSQIDKIAVSHIHSKAVRAKVLQSTPYEKTFYIDSDTLFIKECPEIFDYIDKHYMALSLSNLTDDPDNPHIPSDFPFFNCGIIGYDKNSQVAMRILQIWMQEIQICLDKNIHSKDEPAFRKVIFENDYKINLLPNEYNFRPQSKDDLTNLSGVKIIHSHDEMLEKIKDDALIGPSKIHSRANLCV